MNWIDLIIVVILILSLVMGFINGFVKEVASLAALILGIWGAIKFSGFTAEKLGFMKVRTARSAQKQDLEEVGSIIIRVFEQILE